MLRKNIIQLLNSTILLVTVISAHAELSPATILNTGAEPEGITLNSSSGNYTIVYETLDVNGEPMLFKTEYVPPTKISPKSSTELTVQGELVNYEFTFESDDDSQQKIISAEINTGDDNILTANIGSPKGWQGMFIENSPYSVAWLLTSNDLSLSIKPDKSLSDFSISSRKLPGVVPVKFRGEAPTLGLSGEGPGGDLGKQLNSILNNDSVSIYTSGPAIANPVPYNSVAILTNMKLHLRGLTDSLYITEPLYIDIAQAIDAAINSLSLKDDDAAEQFLDDLSVLIGSNSKEDDKLITGISVEISDALIRSSQFNIDYIKHHL